MTSEDRNPSPPPIGDFASDEEIELLHTDQIEGTAFSKKWTLAMLLKLGKDVDKEQEGNDEQEIDKAKDCGIDISDELENDLCKLWDMSANKKVSKYLEEFKTVDILLGVIMKSNAPRVVEICMGILGNMACCSRIALNLSENKPLRDLVLATLGSSDAPTLIETTRLLTTCLSNQAAQELWLSAIISNDEVFKKLCFILQSSTNCDLLHATANLIDKLLDTDEEILMDWATSTLIRAVAEAMKQVKNEKSETAAILLHTLQLLSTTDTGVETLVACTETILPLVTNYISSIGEQDDVYSIHGRENSIASAVSVLDVLTNTSPPNIDAVLKHDTNTLAHLLHMLAASKNVNPGTPKKVMSSESKEVKPHKEKEAGSSPSPAAAPTSEEDTPPPPDASGDDSKLENDTNTLAHLLHILAASKNVNPGTPKKAVSSESKEVKPHKEEERSSSSPAAAPTSEEDTTPPPDASGDDSELENDTNTLAHLLHILAASKNVNPGTPKKAVSSESKEVKPHKEEEERSSSSPAAAPTSEKDTTPPPDASGDDSEVEDITCIGTLSKESTVLTEVLMEFFCNLLENSDAGSSEMTTCLNSCDKKHVDMLRQALAESQPELLEVLKGKPSG